MKNAEQSIRPLQPTSPLRLHRVANRVRLHDLAHYARCSPARISEIERFPERARPGEIDRLTTFINEIASSFAVRPGAVVFGPWGSREDS